MAYSLEPKWLRKRRRTDDDDDDRWIDRCIINYHKELLTFRRKLIHYELGANEDDDDDPFLTRH